MNIKKFLIGVSASVAMLGALSVPAFAASGGLGYGEQPGYSQASGCGATHGSFSYFDGETNLGVNSLGPGTPEYHDGAVGQEVGATGFNNSQTDCQL